MGISVEILNKRKSNWNLRNQVREVEEKKVDFRRAPLNTQTYKWIWNLEEKKTYWSGRETESSWLSCALYRTEWQVQTNRSLLRAHLTLQELPRVTLANINLRLLLERKQDTILSIRPSFRMKYKWLLSSCVIAQEVRRWLLTAVSRVQSQVIFVIFVADKMTLIFLSHSSITGTISGASWFPNTTFLVHKFFIFLWIISFEVFIYLFVVYDAVNNYIPWPGSALSQSYSLGRRSWRGTWLVTK